MSELVSVKGDQNTHGGGDLQASNNSGKMYVNGKLVVMVDSTALADNAGHQPPTTNSATGSSKLFVQGIAVHRNNDARYCGAATIVSGQTKLYAG